MSVALTLGQTSVDLERPVTLAAFTSVERGSTEAAQSGGELDLTWALGASERFRHGPFFGLSLLNQEIKGFSENGTSSCAAATPSAGGSAGFVPTRASPMSVNSRTTPSASPPARTPCRGASRFPASRLRRAPSAPIWA